MVLLDIDLPAKESGDVAIKFKTDPALGGTPILFFTTLISAADAGKKVVVYGGLRFPAKPLTPGILVEVVDSALGRFPAAA